MDFDPFVKSKTYIFGRKSVFSVGYAGLWRGRGRIRGILLVKLEKALPACLFLRFCGKYYSEKMNAQGDEKR